MSIHKIAYHFIGACKHHLCSHCKKPAACLRFWPPGGDTENITALTICVICGCVAALCLYLAFQPRIQESLDRTREAWNHHQIRTAGYRIPVAIYELSRETAIQQGYWPGDPGDDVRNVDAQYGVEGDLDANGPPVAPEEGDKPIFSECCYMSH
ncbi:hypothetical protein C8J56DRAFT_787895 [Mycena floridula]|nr:hypothetical protein C8J56DRAFT_787895 [Mycena floridula]